MHTHPGTKHQPATAGHVIHWAPFYDVAAFLLTLGREKQVRRQTVEMAAIRPGQAVLDVGCGTGSLTVVAKAAAGASGGVSGIDPAPEMVEMARKKAAKEGLDIDFRLGVIEELPYEDGAFDVVLSSLMLHHLPEDVKHRGLREVARVLKPGGTFLAVDLAMPSHSAIGHLAAMFEHGGQVGLETVAAMLAEAGFEGISTGRMKFRALSFIKGTRAKQA